MTTPEARARQNIDAQLIACGWSVQGCAAMNLYASRGVATLKRVQAGLKRYRASVLKAACEGRLVEQDTEDEPITEFLEHI